MAMLGDLMAQLQGGNQKQQAMAEQFQGMWGQGGGGLLGGLMAQVGAPQAALPQGDSPMLAALRERLGGQGRPSQGDTAGNLMQQASQRLAPQGAQPAPANQAMALMGGAPAAQQAPGMDALVQQFRQMFGRDPQNQQELAMIGGPSVSQMMG